LGIHNTRQYENVVRLTAKQNVAFEVLSYHVTASEEDVQRVSQISVPEATQVRLYAWEFNDMLLTDDETVLASMRMFIELDFTKKFRIPHDVMCRWILSVKKNYRPVIYHNWRHAFNVAQTMFSMITVRSIEFFANQRRIFKCLPMLMAIKDDIYSDPSCLINQWRD
jgi:hypothetical protein